MERGLRKARPIRTFENLMKARDVCHFPGKSEELWATS
jgi:hypothetical protein